MLYENKYNRSPRRSLHYRKLNNYKRKHNLSNRQMGVCYYYWVNNKTYEDLLEYTQVHKNCKFIARKHFENLSKIEDAYVDKYLKHLKG